MMTHKKAEEASNSITHLPIPFGDINNRRFVTAVLAGVLGGAGVSAGANLLRQFRELREKRKNDTDDSTIVLTLPKAAESAYESMKGAESQSQPLAEARSSGMPVSSPVRSSRRRQTPRRRRQLQAIRAPTP